MMPKDGNQMKRNIKSIKLAALAAAVVLFGLCGAVAAQTTETQAPAEPPPAQTEALPNQFADLRQLNLTPEQIEKVREINFELKDQRQEANQRLRLANRALAEAIESPTPNETLIAQRSKEVADAQANTIRLRSLTEARVLQVLTPEQRARVREIRVRNQALQDARQRQKANGRAQRGLQGGRVNSLTPIQPRGLRRPPKP
jgi:Spy/CpxP family protein refolding chaperone